MIAFRLFNKRRVLDILKNLSIGEEKTLSEIHRGFRISKNQVAKILAIMVNEKLIGMEEKIKNKKTQKFFRITNMGVRYIMAFDEEQLMIYKQNKFEKLFSEKYDLIPSRPIGCTPISFNLKIYPIIPDLTYKIGKKEIYLFMDEYIDNKLIKKQYLPNAYVIALDGIGYNIYNLLNYEHIGSSIDMDSTYAHFEQ